jgi:hypothetical protein
MMKLTSTVSALDAELEYSLEAPFNLQCSFLIFFSLVIIKRGIILEVLLDKIFFWIRDSVYKRASCISEITPS